MGMLSSRRRTAALAAAAVVALPALTRAADFTWDGTAGNNWFSQTFVQTTAGPVLIDTSWITTLSFLDIPSGVGDNAIVDNPLATIDLTKNISINNVSLTTGASLTIRGNGGVGEVTFSPISITNFGTVKLESIDNAYG